MPITEPWYPVSEGYAVLKEARLADVTKVCTWPRISPNEAKDIGRDFKDGRDRLAAALDFINSDPIMRKAFDNYQRLREE